MTSKISYFKLWREELRHQTALIFVTVFTFLLELVYFVLSVQNTITQKIAYNQAMYTSVTYREDIIYGLTRLCQPQWLLAILTIGLAVYSAFSGFHFLHSKKQMDFYGALPITRSRKFTVLAGSQISIYIVPLFVTMILKVLVISMTGYASSAIMQNIGYSLLCGIVVFLVTWAFAVLAMVLTGHTFIAALGFGIISTYVPLILRYLVPNYQSIFYETYVASKSNLEIWDYFSPASLSYRVISRFNQWQFAEHSKWIVASVLVAGFVVVLAYFLFLKRPAESAGRAIVFPQMKVTLRFLIVIPMALYAGLYLSMFSWNIDKIWLVVGVILGVIFFHAIVEWIYEFNIRTVFSHKLDIAVTLACCFLFVLFFWMDLGGYDSFVPKANEVESAVIFTGNLRNGYYWERYDKLPQMSQEAVEDVITFAEYVVEERLTSDEDYTYADEICVIYAMKDGSIKRRHYYVKEDFDYSLFEKCYDTPEYKPAVYRIYQTDISRIGSIQFYDGANRGQTMLEKDKIEQFLSIYLEELKKASYQEICSLIPVAEAMIGMPDGRQENYVIYPIFEETIAFLEENDVPLFDISKYTIKKAVLSIWDEKYNMEQKYVITDEALLDSYRDQYIVAGDTYLYKWGKNVEIEYMTATVENESESMEVNLVTDMETVKRLLESIQ